MNIAASATAYVFDLGNTRLKYAALDADGRIGEVFAIAHDGEALPADWRTALPARFEAAYIASVASPGLRVALLDGLTLHCRRCSLARPSAALAGLRVAYPDPSMLGIDRFLAMLGARRRGDGPWLVVGIGTAVTLDLIDAEGLHHGGRIAPSPALMREALHARAAQLPAEGGAFRDFADNTPDALRAGCDGAALALIEAGLRDAEARLGVCPRLLLHGGGIDALSQLPALALRAPALVLEGLAAWAQAMTTGAGSAIGSAIDSAADTIGPC
jgi:type III pantothenate kinase